MVAWCVPLSCEHLQNLNADTPRDDDFPGGEHTDLEKRSFFESGRLAHGQHVTAVPLRRRDFQSLHPLRVTAEGLSSRFS